MALIHWEYYVAYCSYVVTKKGGVFNYDEGEWRISLDKEYSLSEGLQQLGKNGWELVAVQKLVEYYGGQVGGDKNPPYFYIFKRPT